MDFEGFFYSVHYSNINSSCSVRATSKTIEIYIGSERVAAHPRNYNTFKRYKTLPEHMPENHKSVYGWSSDRFLSWAEKTGPTTREYINRVLESREYPVQTYRTCMGIMRSGNNHSNEIMETACREALDKNTISFKYFSIILKQVTARTTESKQEKIIDNDNVRGRSAFVGGGINA